jgi:uncharacterized membrane protein
MLSTKTLIAISVLGVLQSLYFYTQLPERVAMHFGNGGFPDSWASNEVNLAISVVMYVCLAAMFIAIPSTLKYIPVRFVSLPNRDYWLAKERIESTIKQIGHFFNLFGTALLAFFLILGYLVYRANMSDPVVLNERAVWSITGCFLLFTVVWLVVLFRKFRLPGQAKSTGVDN